jgi:hypothetical protein
MTVTRRLSGSKAPAAAKPDEHKDSWPIEQAVMVTLFLAVKVRGLGGTVTSQASHHPG